LVILGKFYRTEQPSKTSKPATTAFVGNGISVIKQA
jgi:hypothetical protein